MKKKEEKEGIDSNIKSKQFKNDKIKSSNKKIKQLEENNPC